MLHEYLIRKEDAEVFCNLIPLSFREEIERGNLYGIVTFDDIVAPDRLVGVVLVRVRHDWQEIVWVALSDGYQEPEYAADLIRIRTESARERAWLRGTFSEFPVQEAVRADYFACAGFSYEKIPSEVYSLPTDFGAGTEKMPLPEEDESRIFRLRQMTELQKEQLQLNFINSVRPLPLEIPVDWAKYDPDATIFYLRDGVIEACLFMVRHPDFYALEAVFGIETPGSYALLGYYGKYGSELFGKRTRMLIPVFMYSVEKYMSNNPRATAGEIALTWVAYDNSRKKGGNLSFDSYIRIENRDALGIDLLDTYDDYSEYPEWGRMSLCNNEGVYCASAREAEAVYERYWEKIEAFARRKGYSGMVLIQRRIAQETLEFYKSGKVPAYKISRFKFTGKQPEKQTGTRHEDFKRPPVSVKERTVKAALFAGLLVGREEALEEMKQPPGNGLAERAEYAVKADMVKTIGEGLKAYLALAGVNIETGEEVPAEEIGSLMFKTAEIGRKLSYLVESFNTEVLRRMVEEVENEEGFKKELREQIDGMTEIDEKVAQARWARIRELPNFEEIKDSYENAMAELKKQMAAMTELSMRITVLGKRKELADYTDIMIEELFAVQIRTISYYIDSIECYLKYLLDGTPISAMHGVFIREKIESDAPCPDPNVVLKEQIDSMSPSFKGLAPWETDCTTIFGAWKRMQRRKNRLNMGTDEKKTAETGKEAPGQNPVETGKGAGDRNPDKNGEETHGFLSVEGCEERVRELERKKNLHPELFRKLMITNIFEEIPELTELFDEAFEVRKDVIRLYRDRKVVKAAGASKKEKKPATPKAESLKAEELYLRVNAIYNTLLRRVCYINKSARMTMKELLIGRPDFSPCEYDYSEKEMKVILSDINGNAV